jgi:hypothetical protein
LEKTACLPVFPSTRSAHTLTNRVNQRITQASGKVFASFFKRRDAGGYIYHCGRHTSEEGPAGFGANGYLAASAPMLYTIYFENKKEATAPAWKIVVVDTLDAGVFDASSVAFTAMSHTMGVPVRTNNILTWTFENIELPPNITPPQGEGWVTFTVKPKAGLPTGTQITNQALITFDLNTPLSTNTTLDTLDFDAPKTIATTATKVPVNIISITTGIEDHSAMPHARKRSTAGWALCCSMGRCERPGRARGFGRLFLPHAHGRVHDSEENAVDEVRNAALTPSF